MPSPAHPYLQDQLIAYIGNKRALQPFLADVFGRLAGPGAVFLDPFAGSGAVARLARWLGYRVLANDWEPFAFVLNYAYLCVGRSEAQALFQDRAGAQAPIEELNALQAPREEYVARHYAPRRTEDADYRTERLFYTRENALRIDAMRERLEEMYPGFRPATPEGQAEKYLLLASLLYGASKHVNTSGVFKACHKGFGGHGRDALGRILAPIRLRLPELLDGPPAEVGCQEAAAFARGRAVDLCYLDPPYNQHQYGSNYHLLNTIALWDRPAVSEERRADGQLARKAGIREDWVKTRSLYCYRASAGQALAGLLREVDARRLVLSYNSDGLIPFEQLEALLEGQGELELYGGGYVKYRGGRQSIGRQVHNLELALVVDRGRPGSAAQRARRRRLYLQHRLGLLLRGAFHPLRVAAAFPASENGITVRLAGGEVLLPMRRLHRFAPEAASALAAASASAGELEELHRRLSACACRDRAEELEVLAAELADSKAVAPGASRASRASSVASADASAGAGQAQRRALWLLRKLAHPKHRRRYEECAALLARLAEGGRYPVLARGLEAIRRQADARFAG
jgi:adenine-specific DNA-methyltransferase